MKIFINSLSSKMVYKVFDEIQLYINKLKENGDLNDIIIYSNTNDIADILLNVKVEFVEFIDNLEEFLLLKEIKIVVTNQIYDFMINNKSYFFIRIYIF